MGRQTNNYVRILRFSGVRVAAEYCVFFDDRDPVDVTRAAEEVDRTIRAHGGSTEAVLRGGASSVRAAIYKRCSSLPCVRVIGLS